MIGKLHSIFPRAARPFGTLLLLAATVIGTEGAVSVSPVRAAEPYTVKQGKVEDSKAVFATVRSKDLTEARVRTPGTVMSLNVDEGAEVKAGEVLAVVADPKIALRIKALDAQIVAIQSQVSTAQADYDRALRLVKRGVTPQARVDQLKTALDVAVNELAATRAERQVSEAQTEEGEVLAPADGRVLKVPLTVGSVVMPGETVATIAANEFLLRIELPERHARFMKVGDTIMVGSRGLSSDRNGAVEGRISQVYPQLQSGRLVADAEVTDLSGYFVGERARVWISAGERSVILVPPDYVFQRFGLDFARLKKKDGEVIDVIVQLGREAPFSGGKPMREVLAGLRAGDELVYPAGAGHE